MPDLYRKERRRKRLQQKKEYTLPPTIRKRKKPRRGHNSRSHDELIAEDINNANN